MSRSTDPAAPGARGARALRRLFPLGLLLAAGVAAAVQTEIWVVSTRTELAQGELHGLVLDPGGDVVLGFTHAKVKTDETTLWCGLAGEGDALIFGTGSGKIIRLTGDKLETIHATGELLVTSLVRARAGGFYAATLPNGKVFKVDAAGKPDLFCTLPAKHVWALVEHQDGNLYAATGPGGKVFQIDAGGRFRLALDTKREHALALALTPDGSILVGTASPGLVYSFTPDGKARVLADFGDAEVKDLLALAGEVWAAVNSGVKVAPAEFLRVLTEASAKAKTTEEEAEQAQPAVPGPVVQSALWRIPEDRGPQEVHAFANAYLTALKREKSGSVLVATSSSGRVYRVTADRKLAVALDLPESQVLALVMRDDEPVAAATGNPGAAYRIGRSPAEDAAYTSDAFDAKLPSSWGGLSWTGTGKLRAQARSGNVAVPDETWSDWSTATEGQPAAISCAPGRFLQVRFTWGEPSARLSGFKAAYVPENQRPVVMDVQVLEQPDPNALAGGQPPNPVPGKPFPPEVRRLLVRKAKWQARDPNDDVLVYWLHYRLEGHARWIAANVEPFRGVEANWDVSDLPDGWYELKVAASDEMANSRESALAGERTSARFLVDGGRPTIADGKIGADKKVTGRALDEHGPIGRIDWKLASGLTWTRIPCVDRVFDEKAEEFAFDLDAAVPADGDTLYVRATDAAGNTGVVAIDLPGR